MFFDTLILNNFQCIVKAIVEMKEINILIVEDDKNIVNSLQSYIGKLGYNIIHHTPPANISNYQQCNKRQRNL